jgi:small subunit ribosomal protein S21
VAQWKEHDFSRFKGIAVTARDDEDSERFIRRFMKKVRNEGILNELWDKSHYEKPSVRRRKKSARARFLRKIEDKERGNF